MNNYIQTSMKYEISNELGTAGGCKAHFSSENSFYKKKRKRKLKYPHILDGQLLLNVIGVNAGLTYCYKLIMLSQYLGC